MNNKLINIYLDAYIQLEKTIISINQNLSNKNADM